MSSRKWRENKLITDTAGYGLLLLAAATGWLPGPGGIPLALAGLSLLSIHNKWASDLREYVLRHGGKAVQIFFPRHMAVEWLYDVLAILLFALSTIMIMQHWAIWQVSISVALYAIALFIALMNRDRMGTQKRRRKKSEASKKDS